MTSFELTNTCSYSYDVLVFYLLFAINWAVLYPANAHEKLCCKAQVFQYIVHFQTNS